MGREWSFEGEAEAELVEGYKKVGLNVCIFCDVWVIGVVP